MGKYSDLIRKEGVEEGRMEGQESLISQSFANGMTLAQATKFFKLPKDVLKKIYQQATRGQAVPTV